MKRIFIIIAMLIILCSCTKTKGTTTTKSQEPQGLKSVNFNRISLNIPEDWKYSTNPKAVPGTDQIRLSSDDTNRILLITLTNARDDITIQEAVIQGGKSLVQRVLSSNEFSDCLVEGGGGKPYLWGREGTLVSFNLIKESPPNSRNVVMKIYCLGEELIETKEVLFISAFIVGEEKDDMEKIVRSMKILDK